MQNPYTYGLIFSLEETSKCWKLEFQKEVLLAANFLVYQNNIYIFIIWRWCVHMTKIFCKYYIFLGFLGFCIPEFYQDCCIRCLSAHIFKHCISISGKTSFSHIFKVPYCLLTCSSLSSALTLANFSSSDFFHLFWI